MTAEERIQYNNGFILGLATKGVVNKTTYIGRVKEVKAREVDGLVEYTLLEEVQQDGSA